MHRDRYFPWVLMLGLVLSHVPALAGDVNTPGTLPPGDDDFTPGLGIFAALVIMVMIVVFILLLGIGLAVGLVVCALVGALTAVGILSSSATIAFLRRSPTQGFRALFLQLGAAAGIPCGITGAWIVSWLAHCNWSVLDRFLIGGVAGFACGVLVAWLFNTTWSRIATWIRSRYDRRFHKVEAVENSPCEHLIAGLAPQDRKGPLADSR